MTPEEAMRSKFANDMSLEMQAILKLLLDGIKATETRRCAAVAKLCLTNKVLGQHVANDILCTGGLTVEE